MLTRERILELFKKLNEKLKISENRGEIGIVGGAVMCLVFQTRQATKDVDGIFQPSSVIRTFAKEIADEENLPEDWLNDGVKGFLINGFEREEVITLSHLFVWSPEPEYMLALKCISARVDTHDGDDIKQLINFLKLKTLDQVLGIVSKYYPNQRIPAKASFFVEEIFQQNE